MKRSETNPPARAARRLLILLALAPLALAGCAGAGPASTGAAAAAPSPDPRVGLGAGYLDAETAFWNLRLVSSTPPPPRYEGMTNSDMAFLGDHVVQGNYNGILFWNVRNPQRPTLAGQIFCPGSQNDVSVFGDLLFVSTEGLGARLDCGAQGIQDSVSSAERMRGIRIFDISNLQAPRYVANVQTCRGSHTHTLVPVADPNHVYIYVSGYSRVRPPEELAGCSALPPDEDPNSARFRLEIIRVPLNAPEQARIVSQPRIFSGLEAAPRRPEEGEPRDTTRDWVRGQRTGPEQCHDITVYTEIGLAGGACRGYGFLLDIRNVENPQRLDQVVDPNFAFWHSATFSNAGDKVLFTDEWGGGTRPRCRATDRPEWGADALFRIVDRKLRFVSYFKMPAAQTEFENCVAHNGSLIPVPGRDIMVQGWYQGGVSVFDWTDPANPREIAFFDRGPMDADSLNDNAGSWSAYWYNGYIYSSEMARGLDVLELVPSAHLSQNEIDAAKSVRTARFNPQTQQRVVWPSSFAVPRAYLDQLERNNGLAGERIAAARAALDRAERAPSTGRRAALTALASELEQAAGGARDAARVRALAGAVRELANAG